MKKTLGAIAFVLLLAAGVWVNSRLPAPHVKAREAVGESHGAGTRLTGQEKYYRVSFNNIGEGPRVVMFASAGREASDFNELATELAQNNYRTLLPDPPGIGGSDLLQKPTLKDIAKTQIRGSLWLDYKSSPTDEIVYIGHAFGNRVARMAAHQNPENVRGVILLAAGGQVPMEPEAQQAARNIFNPLRSYKSRMKDVKFAFFAEGNEVPPHWKRGWHTKTAMAQGKALAASYEDDSWHCAGGVPMLIVQPMQDRLAAPENAYALKEKCSQDIEIVEVQNAGHALLPEQPEAVAKAVLDFLTKHHPIPPE